MKAEHARGVFMNLLSLFLFQWTGIFFPARYSQVFHTGTLLRKCQFGRVKQETNKEKNAHYQETERFAVITNVI
jgi:hypothetical protein